MSFDGLWAGLLPIGREPATGGYRRYAWTAADLECREWFAAAAGERGLPVETDRNGNLWAWRGDPSGLDALAIGSHLDSVPDGGAFDGPLGVVSAFAALDVVSARGLAPGRPVAVVAFADEEGARFGVACAGSRLLTGDLPADRALSLRDGSGMTMAEAMTAAGHDPTGVGTEPDRVARIGCFVELHIEQGRGSSTSAPQRRASRARSGRMDAGDSSSPARPTMPAPPGCETGEDPMLAYAASVLAAREAAERHGALATFGKVWSSRTASTPSRRGSRPGWTPAAQTRIGCGLVADLSGRTGPRSAAFGPNALTTQGGRTALVTEESWTPSTTFDDGLRDRLAALLGGAPVLPTGAGHDAGILAAAGVPSAMLFVRNPTGVSHSPAEHAERDDCLAGVDALAQAIETLAHCTARPR